MMCTNKKEGAWVLRASLFSIGPSCASEFGTLLMKGMLFGRMFFFFFLISKKQILYIAQKTKCTQDVNKKEPKQQKNTPKTLPTPHPSEEV